MIAQKAFHDGEKRFGFGPGRGHMARMMLRGLDLTDDQKARVKDIFASSRTDIQPILASMKENRQKMETATANGAFDQSQVEALANEQGALMARLIVEREKTKSQIFAILTDAQKTKATEMRQKFEQRMKDHKPFEAKPEGGEF